MRHYLLLTLKMFCFWWIIFSIDRLIFILFFFQKFNNIPAGEIAATFLHGAPLDLSAVCYVMILPVLLTALYLSTANSAFRTITSTYNAGVLLLTSLICVYDLAIYSDWGTKLSYRALQYLEFANQGAAFTDIADIILLLVLVMLQVAFGWWLVQRIMKSGDDFFRIAPGKRLPLMVLVLLLIGIMVLAIRGGWQQIPINESSAYFSKHQIVNDAAVNTFWNAGKKALGNSDSRHQNPYQFLQAAEAESRITKLYTPARDSTIQILSTTRPNVVIFLLESFTADVVEALGGEKKVTPNLDTLIQNGVLFTNIYSQGFRTDQGLAAVLSGYPAQPNFSIIMSPEKYHALEFLPQVLARQGYHTSFFYGGETAFANMKAYLLKAGVYNITDKSSFPAEEMNAKWGAHDGYVFQKQAMAMIKEPTPFFSVILSLSSHEPFTVPMQTIFQGKDVPSQFKNSCAYTDLSLREYFISVKKEPWYPNTLFILLADHGHLMPRNLSPREPARFRIPVVFFGEVLKPEFRGRKMDGIGMQTDITATLLSQLNIASNEFSWSNNLLNPYRNNFAYYTSDDAFGWINDNGIMLFDFKTNSITHSTLSIDENNDGKAFLQTMFEQYISY